MSQPFKPWNPITAARAKNLNLGEAAGDLYRRYGIDPKATNAPDLLEAAQRRSMPPLLQGHLDRWEMRAAAELQAMHAVGVRVDRQQARRLVVALDGMVQTLERRLATEAKLALPMEDDVVRLWLLQRELPINDADEKMDDHLKAIEGRTPKGDNDPVRWIPISGALHTVGSIQDTINSMAERSLDVPTDAQANALKKIYIGACRWLHIEPGLG